MTQQMQWEGKSKGGVLGYKIFLFFLKYTGIRAAYFILYFVALYYVLFARKAMRAASFYFTKIWGFSRLKALGYSYLSFYRFGQTLIDKVAILGNFYTRFTYYFDGVENLRKLVDDGRGAILISAHIGNWEIAGHFLKKLNTPVNVVMLDAEHSGIKQVLEKAMQNRKFNIISIKPDFSHLLEIHRALQNKEFICIHGDRFMPNMQRKTYRVKFKGYYASFPYGPFELAVRFKVPYTFVYAIKETNKHYHFFATPGRIPETGGAEQIIDEYLESMERVLKNYPEQWFNYYDFWEKTEETQPAAIANIAAEKQL